MVKKIKISKPTFEHELILWEQGMQYVAGVDEVGRGCFAGPVVTAAVILPQDFTARDEVNDSKVLSAKKREKLSIIIKKEAVAFAIAEIGVPVINEIGIGKAAQVAFKKAIVTLPIKPDFILIDAFYITGIEKHKQKPIIHGDRLSVSIAAASIIAKVYRDELMQKLHPQYAVYDFFTNKGYGTKKHRDAIGKYGLCDLHRTSFNLSKFLL
jgi:ribonuclease HII